MSANIAQFKPAASELLADLDRYRAAIVSGEIQPTTVVLVARDRVNESVSLQVLGETLACSHTMGLLTFAAHDFYEKRLP